MRDSLERWIETRSLLAKEQAEWRTGREVLQNRIDLMQAELDGLKRKTEESRAEITEADGRRAGLAERNEALKTAAHGLEEAVPALESRLLALLARLPEPVRERVRPLSTRIPVEGPGRLSLSERFQNVAGILNELNKFSREITVASEVRDLKDGTRAEVQVLYAGLAQAWYCNNSGTLAGIGRPGPSGWEWVEENRIGPRVLEALAVYRNEKAAVYSVLPVRVVDPERP